jgi:rhodanese-related sulfurtransferase
MAGITQAAKSLRIDADELRRRQNAGEAATLLDARTPKAWDSSDLRMAGAIRVDAAEFHIDAAWPRDLLTVACCT